MTPLPTGIDSDSRLESLRAAMEHVAIGVVIANDQGVLLGWNRAALAMQELDPPVGGTVRLSDLAGVFQCARQDGPAIPVPVVEWPLARLIRGERVVDEKFRVFRRDIGRSWVICFTGSTLAATEGSPALHVMNMFDVTESVRAAEMNRLNEAALRESELRLRGVVDTAVDGIMTVDEMGTIQTVNPAVVRIFGYRPAELIGTTITAMIPQYDPSQDGRDRDRARGEPAKNTAAGRESVGRRKDASTFPLELSVGEMELNGRRVYTAIVRDISARKEAERRLLNKQNLLRTLIEGIPDPVYIKDARFRFMYANSAVARLSGRTVEQCVGIDAVEMLGPEVGTKVNDADRAVLESVEPHTYEESVPVGDRTTYYLTTKCRYLGGDGSVGGLIGISRDITPQKLAEQTLRDSERHLREVIDSIPLAVLVLTADGIVHGVNRVAQQSLAVEPVSGEVAPGVTSHGRRLVDLPWFDGVEGASAVVVAAVGRAAAGERVRLDGTPVSLASRPAVFDITLAPMHDSDGSVNHLILSAVDVTDQKAAAARERERQAELAHLERVQTMGHLAAGLAHELNQPLGAIVNYTAACRHSIAAGRIDPARLDASLGEVVAEAARAGEIIRRLRSFVKKRHPQLTANDLNPLVTDSIRMLSYELRQVGVAVESRLTPGLPRVAADPVQIVQVMVNLLRNAIDAMRETGPSRRRLTITTAAGPDGGALIEVADTGDGVPAADLGRLFDAFYTTKPDGLGIGLALCRIIVENHGGRLSVRNNPDRGLTFAFTLRPAGSPDISPDVSQTVFNQVVA